MLIILTDYCYFLLFSMPYMGFNVCFSCFVDTKDIRHANKAEMWQPFKWVLESYNAIQN